MPVNREWELDDYVADLEAEGSRLRAEVEQLKGEVAIARGLLDRYKAAVGPLSAVEAVAGSVTPDPDTGAVWPDRWTRLRAGSATPTGDNDD